MMQHVHVDRREKSRPGATYGQYFVSWKWPAAVLVGDPKYRPFGVESGSHLTVRGAAHYAVPRKLWLCRASIVRALRVHPLFSHVRISLSPRVHISQGPTLTAWGLGCTVYPNRPKLLHSKDAEVFCNLARSPTADTKVCPPSL